jgi:hypothetical protein
MKSDSKASRRSAPSRSGSSSSSRIAILLLVLATAGCGSGVPAARVAPAPYDLGSAKTVALLDASGMGPVDRFVDALISETQKRGYTVVDARRFGVRNGDLVRDRPRATTLFKEVGPDALLEVRLQGCTSLLKNRTDKETNSDGLEYLKTLYGYRGECNARLEIVDVDGRGLASFEVHGTHNGVIYEEPRSQEQEPVLNRAVDATAAMAAGRLAPRRVTD